MTSCDGGDVVTSYLLQHKDASKTMRVPMANPFYKDRICISTSYQYDNHLASRCLLRSLASSVLTITRPKLGLELSLEKL
jgi:hypothetical protein